MPLMGKILFVDDDKVFTLLMSRMLSDLGYSVHTANEGERAIDLYMKARASFSPYDVVVLDLHFPNGMGGEETIKRLLSIDPNVRAIISSGLLNNVVMKNFRTYGFIGVLPKPYDINELDDTLRRLIKQQPSEQK